MYVNIYIYILNSISFKDQTPLESDFIKNIQFLEGSCQMDTISSVVDMHFESTASTGHQNPFDFN